MKEDTNFSIMLMITLILFVLLGIFFYPECLQMNNYSLHKRVKALENFRYER